MELTQISPFGILILEPVTTLTDFIAASVAYFAFFILQKQKHSGPVHQLMKYYFLIMGIGLTSAAFIGHAFQYLLTPDWKAIGWIGSSLAILMLILASVEYIRPVLGGNKCRIIQMLALIQISIFLLALSIPGTRSFDTVKLNSAIGLIGFVLPIHAYLWYRFRAGGSGFIAFAIIWGILPAIVYNTQFTLHAYLNYHDISHILMAIYLYIMLRGALDLRPGSFGYEARTAEIFNES